jgi:hypothetical protein
MLAEDSDKVSLGPYIVCRGQWRLMVGIKRIPLSLLMSTIMDRGMGEAYNK